MYGGLIVIQLLILALFLLAAPMIIGSLTAGIETTARGGAKLTLCWVNGQFMLWAGFQLICVPMVLKGRPFRDVVILFLGFMAAMVLLAAAIGIRNRAKAPVKAVEIHDGGRKREGLLLWAVFWVIFVFQLVQAVRLTYADGDDAFYVAVSSITDDSDTMYQKLPYTGGATLLDARHGLAPFPIWIAFLARVSGIPAVSVAHVTLPVMLISMTYVIFFWLGCRLFPDKDGRLPLFLVFSEILILFGDYSIHSMENFMIARSRQGKAALGSIVIPFLLYLLLLVCQKIKDKQTLSLKLYLMLAVTGVSGCLCSTLGAFLLCLLIGVTGLIAAGIHRRWNVLIPLAVCCLPCVCYALIYLLSD